MRATHLLMAVRTRWTARWDRFQAIVFAVVVLLLAFIPSSDYGDVYVRLGRITVVLAASVLVAVKRDPYRIYQGVVLIGLGLIWYGNDGGQAGQVAAVGGLLMFLFGLFLWWLDAKY